MTVPAVLLGDEFLPVWQRVARTLDQRGLDDRRAVALPQGLPDTVFARLGELLRVRFPSTRRRLDLSALDAALERHGADLLALLAAAGCPPTGRREARDAERDRRARRDEALTAAATEALGLQPWVVAWAEAVRPGLPDDGSARAAVDAVARVLAAADEPGLRSRAEVAARVLGDAHALDRGEPTRRLVGTALALRAGRGHRDDAELWADAGLPGDLVATPVPTWSLPLLGDGAAAAVRAATAAGAPGYLATLTLREPALEVPPGTVVLSVENPRLLEAAVQRALPVPMLCTLGNPTTAPLTLVRGLLAAGAEVRHHGDLDPSGVAITARLARLGVVPWRMTAADYRAAVSPDLRPFDGPVPPTPWDPDLQHAMSEHGRAVDEERVMDELLDAAVREGRRRAL
ncbi:DUF2399 domain-containing protein [Actinomycetospora soli]|uniref:DUF2399 domain-containing protein n=1 Tax=Actinomycetospora soli TaxID=2893887 RepID=UPI001E492D25|nr:DUF2399 domain-containing protein [Actinomycetospora soli]MCD2186363.1 DUF2399 domain-containing protein [Actinomycetospora soli]